MTTTHSPLPWQHDGAGLIYGQATDYHDEAPLIADVISDRDRMMFGRLTDAERANAAFIVRACNSYARLMDAAMYALTVLTDIAIDLDDDSEEIVAAVRLELHEAISSAIDAQGGAS